MRRAFAADSRLLATLFSLPMTEAYFAPIALLPFRRRNLSPLPAGRLF